MNGNPAINKKVYLEIEMRKKHKRLAFFVIFLNKTKTAASQDISKEKR